MGARSSGAALLLVLACTAAPATADAASATYSDICRTPQSDDLAGHTIRIDWVSGRPDVSYYWSDGQVRGPARASDVAYSRRDGRLRFKAKTPDGEATFEGRLAGGALVGALKDAWEAKPVKVRLPRRASDPALDCSAPAPRS